MKYCHAPRCPHRLATGSAAEYRDEVETCADCGSPLSDEPPPPSTDESADDDAPVTIATYPNPHEAQLAVAALAAHGIDAVVNCDHGQFYTAASWVQVQVARAARDVAGALLETGPPTADDAPSAATGSAVAEDARSSGEMRGLRRQHRFALARWFLYAQAVSAFFVGLGVVPLFLIPAGLAVWSRHDPRRAFAVAIGMQTIVVAVAIILRGPFGLATLVPFLASYMAWAAAAPDPPTPLVTSPYPATPTVRIGDAWDVAAVEQPDRPIRLLLPLLVVAGLLVVVWAGWFVSRTGPAQRLFEGTTEVALVGDADSAVRQSARLGQARLDHELQALGLRCDVDVDEAADTFEIVGVDNRHIPAVTAIAERLLPDWTVEATSPGGLRVALRPERRDAVVANALDRTLAALGRRFAATVVSAEQGDAGGVLLRVRLAGDWPPDRIRSVFDEPAMLEFREVRYPANVRDPVGWSPPTSAAATRSLFGGTLPPGIELVEQPVGPVTLYWPLRRSPIIVGLDLVDAAPSIDAWGDPAISFDLTEDAGDRLEAATRRSLGRRMTIVLRGEAGDHVVSAPVINGVIRTRGIIQGGFTEDDAGALARRLRAGSLPLRLTPASPPNP